MQKWFCLLLLGFLSLFFLGCQSTKNGNVDLPKIDPARIGNVRVALISQNRVNHIVLVNHGNKEYLTPQDFIEEQSRKDIPMTALKYRDDGLFPRHTTSVVIVEDEDMATILAIAEKERFTHHAQPYDAKLFQEKDWPERDALFLERDGDRFVLVRDEKMIDSTNHATPKSIAYTNVKAALLFAQNRGYRPMNVFQNLDGKDLFQQSYDRLHQDSQKEDKKT